MVEPRSTFPLRFRDGRLRELVREVAAREHVSQNELIEQAVLNDVVARGLLRAAELQQAADRLAELSAEQYEALIDRSLTEFAEGEALPDPVEMRAWSPAPAAERPPRRSAPADRFGALAAFNPRDR